MTDPFAKLQESIEEDQKALGQEVTDADDDDANVAPGDQEEVEPDQPEEKKDDAAAEEKPADPAVAAKPKDEEPKPDGQAYARMRYELKQQERKLAELEAAKNNTVVSPAPVVPNKEEDPAAYLEYKIQEVERKASDLDKWRAQREAEEAEKHQKEEFKQALSQLIDEHKKTSPEYDSAISHLGNELLTSIKKLNPKLGDAQIAQKAEEWIFDQSVVAAQQGINPGAYFEYLAKNHYGYVKPQEQPKPAEAVKLKPDLTKVAANRQKSPGMAAAAGGGSPKEVSIEDAVNMPMDKFASMTAEEIKRLDSTYVAGMF